jgi:hypothetical protein
MEHFSLSVQARSHEAPKTWIVLLGHILCSAGESHTESASKTREAISDINSDEEIFVFPLSWIEFRSSNTLAAEKNGRDA